MAPLTVGSLSHWSLIKKTSYSWISWMYFLNWGSFLSYDSSLCQIDTKSAKAVAYLRMIFFLFIYHWIPLFHFLNSWVIFRCVIISHFIHSPVDRFLSWFQFLARAAMKKVEQMFLNMNLPLGGTARSWSRSIPRFLRNCHADFHSGCTILQPPSMDKYPLCFTSSPAWAIRWFIHFGHSNYCKVNSQSSFAL